MQRRSPGHILTSSRLQQIISCLDLHLLHRDAACFCSELNNKLSEGEHRSDERPECAAVEWGVTYHGDADGVIELVHEDADDGRRQQQQDERIFELQRHKEVRRQWTGLEATTPQRLSVNGLDPDDCVCVCVCTVVHMILFQSISTKTMRVSHPLRCRKTLISPQSHRTCMMRTSLHVTGGGKMGGGARRIAPKWP